MVYSRSGPLAGFGILSENAPELSVFVFVSGGPLLPLSLKSTLEYGTTAPAVPLTVGCLRTPKKFGVSRAIISVNIAECAAALATTSALVNVLVVAVKVWLTVVLLT
ncbi:unannotated protein [freshwater metagenome]|uniref:Unannotated protein n=1 Tax=freshwater metagenome TaxID=449393 RepID=A0A6J6T633_9ZZZZ